jgi:predicted RNase H-like nuclease
VFPAPIRAVLAAGSHAEACALSRQLQNGGIPVQAFHLLGKIRQVDGLLRGEPALAGRLVESHPEVAFLVWNGGRPMEHPKRTAAGRAERLALVERRHPGSFAHIRARFRRGDVADDDILDALALLGTAERLARGEEVRLGGPGERDGCGLPMQIVA